MKSKLEKERTGPTLVEPSWAEPTNKILLEEIGRNQEELFCFYLLKNSMIIFDNNGF